MTHPLAASVSSAAVAAAHADPAFPAFHPRPAQGWINDPNGICYLNGRYHVFFQYNPDSVRHERICWGHQSSADLVNWEQHPVALRPQSGGPDEYGCWSGVVTDDDGVPTAAYSGVRSDGGHSQVIVARGSSDLVSWTQDGRIAATMPSDGQVTAVRDPFLFRFNGRRYAMQGAGLANGHAAVLLYTVQDMTDWKYQGVWLTTENPVAAQHAPAQIWECPQLVRVPDSSQEGSSGAVNSGAVNSGDGASGDDDTWVMMFSLWLSGDTHEHVNGVGHLIGALQEDPATGLPVFVPRSGGKSDFGRDFYAPQVVALEREGGAEPKALLWGWASEGFGREGRRGRSQDEIDAAGWAGVLTFPRELSVVDDALVVRPAPEIEAYRGEPVATSAQDGTLVIPPAAEALVTDTGSTPAGSQDVRLVLVGTDGSRQVVFAGSLPDDGSLRIFVDASIVEVYRTHGVATTVRAYPLPGEEWQLEVPDGAQAEVWKLAHPE
jgi:beta-fructofuranosidase